MEKSGTSMNSLPIPSNSNTAGDPFDDDSLFDNIPLSTASWNPDGAHSGVPVFDSRPLTPPPAKKLRVSVNVEEPSPVAGCSKSINDSSVMFPSQEDSLALKVVSQDLSRWTNEADTMNDSNDAALLLAVAGIDDNARLAVEQPVSKAPSALEADEDDSLLARITDAGNVSRASSVLGTDDDDSLLARMADESEKSLKANGNGSDLEDDPFGGDDDVEILCKIADEQEKIVSDESVPADEDPFESENEDFLCQMADVLEDAADYDGVPVPNRFITGLGRPHPLFVPHILDKVLSYVNSPADIKSSRVVCSEWWLRLQDKASDSFILHNAAHLVNRYPYGLGFDKKQCNTPFETIRVSKIRICDPCSNFKKPEVSEYFRKSGKTITWFGLDANFYCQDHWSFLRSVLNSWCPNLETLELTNLTNPDAMTTYSELSGEWYTRSVNYKLTKVVIKMDPSGQRNHFHGSSVYRCPFSRNRYFFHRMSSARDGGLLTKLVNQSPNLSDFTLHWQYYSLSIFLANTRVFGTNYSNLKRMELIAPESHAIGGMDLRILANCSLNVEEMIMGPVKCGINEEWVERFLRSVAHSLTSLEIRGAQEGTGVTLRNHVIRFTLPDLPLLRNLTITDMSRCRIGNISEILSKTLGLEKLRLDFPEVKQRQKTSALRYVNGMFTRNENNQHGCLKEFKFKGEYAAQVIRHDDVCTYLEVVAPQIQALDISSCFANIRNVQVYKRLEALEEFKIDIRPGDVCEFRVLFGLNTNRLKISVSRNIWIRSYHLETLERALEVEVEGFSIQSSEVKEIAKILAQKSCYTTFTNCRIAKSIAGRGSQGSSRELNNVRLCLANLNVLLQSDLREI